MAVFALLLARAICGDTVLLIPAADTSLIETVPDNNMGGEPYFNAGTTQNHTKNRGLMWFDLSHQIPSGARITSVSLLLTVTREPKDGFAPSTFGLHRVLRAWGEGDKIHEDTRSPGLGAPATANEATWNHRFAGTTNVWTTPGGESDADYAGVPSAVQVIYDIGNSPYSFGSTSALAADVQFWLDTPAANFGWMLISQAESDPFTARRFGSRQDVNNAPLLQIDFVRPPQIDRAEVKGGQFLFQFQAQAGQAYRVEFRDELTLGMWQTLTNLSAPPETVTMLLSNLLGLRQRFYRIVAAE